MRTRLSIWILLGAAVGAAAPAAADTLAVTPAVARPGDPVLVTVTGARETPRGTANGAPLQFFRSRTGYQAVFAVPLEVTLDPTSGPTTEAAIQPISVEVDSVPQPKTVRVKAAKFPETSVVVEDELANPAKADRVRIDSDNAAILGAAARAKGEVLFARGFRRPPGEITSPFGEWRTFNDGHRSQHLGLDLFAREGSRVKAVNAGTVVLVRDCFLAGTVVVVAHGGGIASAYYHLSKVSVAEGDSLAQGDEVGLAGHTGRTTGPHLHLSIHVPGGMVDPASFFKLGIAPAPARLGSR